MTKVFTQTEEEFIKYIMKNSNGKKCNIGDFTVKTDYGVNAYYNGPGGDVEIPKELGEYCSFHFDNGKTIRSIVFHGNLKRISAWDFGKDWKNNKTIEELVFEEGIETIDAAVFSGCKNLERVSLPESLQYLGSGAFKGSPWYEQAMEEMNGCIYIGNFLISSKEDIETADIRIGTKNICGSAFKGREQLQSISLPESLEIIQEQAFCGCSKLKEVVIPKSVTKVEDLAFSGCKELKRFEIENSNAEVACNILGSDKSAAGVIIPDYAFIPNINLADAKPVQKEAFAIAYLTSKERYSDNDCKQYDAYVKKQGKKLIKHIIELSNSKALEGITPYRLKTKDIDEFLDLAKGRAEMSAFLLNWKNRNAKPVDMEKELTKEITKDPYNAADMKKLWTTEKRADGTLRIKRYKGKDENLVIEVPPRIGKNQITCLGELGLLSSEDVFPSEVQQVILPEGLEEIGGTVFKGYGAYNDLQPIVIPKSVKKIDGNAFNENCRPTNLDEEYKEIGDAYYRKDGLRIEAGMIIVDDLLCGADSVNQYESVWCIPKGVRVNDYTRNFPYLYYDEQNKPKNKLPVLDKMKTKTLFEFGCFPQTWDGKLSAIKWEVIDVSDKQIVAITKDILVPIPLSDSNAKRWEDTELRKWLNTVFYGNCFTEEEKEIMEPNSEGDNVSLLSKENIYEFLCEQDAHYYNCEDLAKQGNSYTAARGMYVEKKTGNGKWWLKSVNQTSMRFDEIQLDGGIGGKGSNAYMNNGVCPVICLKKL